MKPIPSDERPFIINLVKEKRLNYSSLMHLRVSLQINMAYNVSQEYTHVWTLRKLATLLYASI